MLLNKQSICVILLSFIIAKFSLKVNIMTTLILFFLILGLLVFVHEFGHFIAARKSGMKVYEFALGFPPFICGFYKDPKTKKLVWVTAKDAKKRALMAGGGKDVDESQEYPSTLYSLNLIPLGGFCKIKGENGEDAKDSDSFGYQKTWKKSIVLVAGVVMNFLLAAVLLAIGFGIGLPTDVSGGVEENAVLLEKPAVVIQHVEDNSPAKKAGLLLGDKVQKIDETVIDSAKTMTQYIKDHKEDVLLLHILRGEEHITAKAQPAVVVAGEPVRLGVILADAALVKYPWHIAWYKGFVSASYALVGIFVSFFLLIKGLIFGQGLAFGVAGPVGIASIIGDSARLGVPYLINITAMISLSLAAMNILPIPALDGGRLFFVLAEKVIGRPVPLKYEQLAHTIGFLLLLFLIVIVTFRDIMGLF